MWLNKGFKILLSLSLLMTTLCTAVQAAPKSIQQPAEKKELFETTAESAMLMAADSGEILFAKNPDKALPMASVTKLMTMLLAVEYLEQGKAKLEDKVVASENAWSMGGSQIYLEPGEEFSYKELLIATAVGSANDASVALAEHIGGSVESFVSMMNERARQLGCTNTHFVNPTGLPAEGHYTSAKDLATIMKECIKHPLFMKVSGIYEHDLRGGEFKLWNTNKLLRWYKGVDSGKTGWTNEAKYCLASSCERDKLRLIAVVMGTPEPKSHFRESIKLYNYGYARYKAVPFEDRGKVVKTVSVDKGSEEKLDLVTKDKVVVVVKKGDDKGFEAKMAVPESVPAPVKAGQTLGYYVVSKNGTDVLKIPLVAKKNIDRRSFTDQINKSLRSILQ